MAVEPAITLVCGGGGVWGVAWMTGLVAGFADDGIDVRNAAAFIGTSAGSVVATQLLASGLTLSSLYARQTDPVQQARESVAAPENLAKLMQLMAQPFADDQQRRQALCRLADDALTIAPAIRRQSIVERLGVPDPVWPDKRLVITALDMDSLELASFDATSRVSLVDAVTASCAIAGVWPPASMNGRRYVDGGHWRTAENAHLAAGSRRVLILAPLGRVGTADAALSPSLADDVLRLEAQGSKVVVISADAASLMAMAPGPLDPATRRPAAEAGRNQAHHEIDEVRAVFES